MVTSKKNIHNFLLKYPFLFQLYLCMRSEFFFYILQDNILQKIKCDSREAILLNEFFILENIFNKKKFNLYYLFEFNRSSLDSSNLFV